MLNLWRFEKNKNYPYQIKHFNDEIIYSESQINSHGGNFYEIKNLNESLKYINDNFEKLKDKLELDEILKIDKENKEQTIILNDINLNVNDLENELGCIELDNIKFKFNIEINITKFEICDISFLNSTINKIKITACNFKGKNKRIINIDENKSSIKSLKIIECNFKNSYKIEKTKIEKLELENNKFEDNLSIENNNFNTIEFKENTIKGKTWIFENIINHLNILEGNNFNVLKISNKDEFHTEHEYIYILVEKSNFEELFIYNTKCNSLKLHNLYNKNNLIIENIKLNELIVDNLNNKSNLEIKKISPNNKNSSISINESNLNEALLFDIDFSKFLFCIEKTLISKVIPNNVTWNFNIINNQKDKNKELSETYRQLKIVCENNKDQFNELKFKSLEHDKHLDSKDKIIKISLIIIFITVFILINIYFLIKFQTYKLIFIFLPIITWGVVTISKDKYKSSKIIYDYFKELFDGIILIYNKITNNNGQNWILPIVWILIINLMFAIYTGCDIWNTFLKLFSAKNFIFNIENTLEICATSNLLFWDLIRRVLTITLIYQTVQAFRKYSRKL